MKCCSLVPHSVSGDAFPTTSLNRLIIIQAASSQTQDTFRSLSKIAASHTFEYLYHRYEADSRNSLRHSSPSNRTSTRWPRTNGEVIDGDPPRSQIPEQPSMSHDTSKTLQTREMVRSPLLPDGIGLFERGDPDDSTDPQSFVMRMNRNLFIRAMDPIGYARQDLVTAINLKGQLDRHAELVVLGAGCLLECQAVYHTLGVPQICTGFSRSRQPRSLLWTRKSGHGKKTA